MAANQGKNCCLDHSKRPEQCPGLGTSQGRVLLRSKRGHLAKAGNSPISCFLVLWEAPKFKFLTQGPPPTLREDSSGQLDSPGLLLSPQEFLKEGTLMKVTGKSRRPRHLFLVSTWPPVQPQDCRILCSFLGPLFRDNWGEGWGARTELNI